MFRLFLLFTLIPLTELYLLIQVGKVIGAFSTIALVLVTGILGAALARHEGMKVLYRAQESMLNGIPPADELLEGLLVFGAGVLLVTPGILTDVLGLLILFPVTRPLFKWILHNWFRRLMTGGGTWIYHSSRFP